ncbi:MAG: hypothetical protein M1830_007234 [Pleopsidium flavum]|nr:MAG: hypothetical protein M1830_007234 [Pleopsidium flavum]
MSDKHLVPRAAFCEDYNEDDHTTLPETRKVANVAAKRSKPELVRLKAAEVRHDGASDSGYSSHTPATLGSGDLSQGAKTIPVPLKLDTAAISSKTRPHLVEKRSQSAHRSSDKASLQRSGSKTQRKENVRHEQCQCQDCVARGRAATMPLDTPWPLDYYPFNQQRPRYDGPPSPRSARHPPPVYMHEVPVVHKVQPRPRALTAQSSRPARPVSFHAGAMPDMMYISPMYMDRGPPPSTSAYAHSPAYPPSSYPPPGTTFMPPTAPAAPPPLRQENYPPPSPIYAQSRPQPRQWTSEMHPSRRSSVYGRPVVEYEEPVYSAPPMERRSSSHRSHREKPSTSVAEDYFRDEDYYLMPPPPPRQTIPIHRPPLRHAVTHASHSRDASVEARVSDRSRKEEPEQSSRSRRPSLTTRPSSTKKSTSYANASGNTKISVESARQRRASYYGHERRQDLEAKQRDIEAYQDAKGSRSIPLTADALKAARKGTKAVGSDSGSQSRASSSREGSEVKTRSSGGGGSGVATKSEAESFTMRFNAGAGVKVDFAGDSVEGRTISLRPSGEDGAMELSIGGRGSKKYIGSEGKQVEYARSGLRREIKEVEELRRTREDMKSAKSSRRSSRSGYSGQGQIE